MAKLEMEEIVGYAFEELPEEMMEEIQGSGDVSPESSSPCLLLASFIFATITRC